MNFFPKIFFCFHNLDALYGPVVGKPFITVCARGFCLRHGHFCDICPNC